MTRRSVTIVALLGALAAPGPSAALPRPQDAPAVADAGLTSFLREHLRMQPLDDDPTTRYLAAPVDLNTYPGNPTSPEARALDAGAAGEVIVPEMSVGDGTPLCAPWSRGTGFLP